MGEEWAFCGPSCEGEGMRKPAYGFLRTPPTSFSRMIRYAPLLHYFNESLQWVQWYAIPMSASNRSLNTRALRTVDTWSTPASHSDLTSHLLQMQSCFIHTTPWKQCLPHTSLPNNTPGSVRVGVPWVCPECQWGQSQHGFLPSGSCTFVYSFKYVSRSFFGKLDGLQWISVPLLEAKV